MENYEGIDGAIRAAFEFSQPTFMEIDGVPFLITKGNDGAQKLSEVEGLVAAFRDRPRRIKESVTVRTPKALADYMNLYADKNHMAFVHSADPFKVDVTLDYHESNDGGAPRWGDHAVSMVPRFTPAYAAWRKRHRGEFSQRATMEFFEDRMVDVSSPDPADVMDMVINFDALTKVTFSSRQRLRDGRVQISYKEEEADSGMVNVFEEMTLFIPVFEGAEPETFKVRIRTRVNDGALNFIFVIANIEELEAAAFERLCDAWRVSFSAHDLREVAT